MLYITLIAAAAVAGAFATRNPSAGAAETYQLVGREDPGACAVMTGAMNVTKESHPGVWEKLQLLPDCPERLRPATCPCCGSALYHEPGEAHTPEEVAFIDDYRTRECVGPCGRIEVVSGSGNDDLSHWCGSCLTDVLQEEGPYRYQKHHWPAI